MIRAATKRYFNAYRGLPKEVWLLALVLFVNRSGTMVLPFLTLYLTSELKLNEASAGQMLSVYGLGSMLGAYFGGRLSESLGSFRLQTICMFLSVPLFLIIPLWNSWQGISVSLLVLAIFYEAVRPANATSIALVTNAENRSRAFALQRLAANLGFSFGPAIGGLLASVNFVLLFVVDALTTLLAALALLYFFRMQRNDHHPAESENLNKTISPLQDKRFVFFLTLMLFANIVFMQFLVTYPLYLHDHFALNKQQIGLMFAVNTSVIVLFEMILIDYTKQWPLVRMMGWGYFLCCMGFGILPFGNTGIYCVFAMLVVTLGEMLSFPNSAAYIANTCQAGIEGRYMGWYTLTHSLAWVIAPILGASIYGVNKEALWIAALMTGVVVLLGFRQLEGLVSDDETALH